MYYDPSWKYTIIIYIVSIVSNFIQLKQLWSELLIRNLFSSIISIWGQLTSRRRLLGQKGMPFLRPLVATAKLWQKVCSTTLQSHQQSLRDQRGSFLVSGCWWNSPFGFWVQVVKGYVPERLREIHTASCCLLSSREALVYSGGIMLQTTHAAWHYPKFLHRPLSETPKASALKLTCLHNNTLKPTTTTPLLTEPVMCCLHNTNPE